MNFKIPLKMLRNGRNGRQKMEHDNETTCTLTLTHISITTLKEQLIFL